MSTRQRGRRSTKGASRRSTAKQSEESVDHNCSVELLPASSLPSEPVIEACIDLSSDDEIEVTEEHINDDSVVCVGSFAPDVPVHINSDSCEDTSDCIQIISPQGSPASNTVHHSPSKRPERIKCPICMDNEDAISASNKQLCATVCGHVFCNECIRAAVQLNHQCPKCRKKLTLKKYHPLYI